MAKYLNLNGVQTLWSKIKNHVSQAIKESTEDNLGVANGIATLDEEGKLVSSQLPNLKTVNGNSIVGDGNISIDLSIYKIVEALPTQDIESNKIYLMVDANGVEGDEYDEYAYINNKWELLGHYRASVELDGYVKFTDEASETQAGVMSTAKVIKLKGIEEEATKDEALTTEEVEAILI